MGLALHCCSMAQQTPAGFRLVTCGSCGEQQLVPEGGANENCYCGKILPKY